MAKKRKSIKLPKQIGGVKIPKEMRKKGEQLIEFARHPLVADVLAAGVVAFAAALRDAGKPREAASAAEPAATGEPPVPAPAAAAEEGAPPLPPRRANRRGPSAKTTH